MKCVICGGERFGLGPGGRKTRWGKMPRCESCQSLERHRAVRSFFMEIYDQELFSKMKVLQFSRDRSVNPEWFREFEVSVYGKNNSLDVQDIDRSSGVYDMVICNHVLEHVPDDGEALRELCRIVSRDGIVFLSVPAPLRRNKTQDWGHADEARHGHYRIYGSDITEKFDLHIPNIIVFKVNLCDEATQTPDISYILSHGENLLLQHISRQRVQLELSL